MTVDMSRHATVIEAMDQNLAAYMRSYGAAGGAMLLEVPGAQGFVTSIPHADYSGALITNLQNTRLDALHGALSPELARRGHGATWWLSPAAHDGTQMNRLLDLGLEPVGARPAMLTRLSDASAPPPVRGLHIAEARSPEERYAWGLLAAEAAGMDAATGAALAAAEAQISGSTHPAQVRYVGYFGGAPVATAARVTTGAVVGIYAIATLPDQRRNGIGAAMTWAAMMHGLTGRERMAVLQGALGDRDRFARIGFRELGLYRLFRQTP